MQANPPQLHSNLKFIQLFRRQSKVISEAAYYLTNLISVESFINGLDANSLSMDANEFQEKMQAARLAKAAQVAPRNISTSRDPQPVHCNKEIHMGGKFVMLMLQQEFIWSLTNSMCVYLSHWVCACGTISLAVLNMLQMEPNTPYYKNLSSRRIWMLGLLSANEWSKKQVIFWKPMIEVFDPFGWKPFRKITAKSMYWSHA